MADTLASPNPTETLALRAPADEAAVTDAVVVVYLNTTTDNAGRPLGIINGYQPAHILADNSVTLLQPRGSVTR